MGVTASSKQQGVKKKNSYEMKGSTLRHKDKKSRQMMMQVVAGEGGVNAVSCQRRRALVQQPAKNRGPVPLNHREIAKTLWVELFLVGLDRPAVHCSRAVTSGCAMDFGWGNFMRMALHLSVAGPCRL